MEVRGCVHHKPNSLRWNICMKARFKSTEVAISGTDPVKVPICLGAMALEYAGLKNCTHGWRKVEIIDVISETLVVWR